jgi:hypothetical protein
MDVTSERPNPPPQICAPPCGYLHTYSIDSRRLVSSPSRLSRFIGSPVTNIWPWGPYSPRIPNPQMIGCCSLTML